MTRDYSKSHKNGDPVVDTTAVDPIPAGAPPREKKAFELHDEEIVKARDEISALIEKARAVQYALSDPNAAKPEHEFLTELQEISKQIHRLNAKWFAGPGYEYTPPPYVPNVPGAPGEPWTPPAVTPPPPAPEPADAPI